jgi:hypothetical protein
MAVLTGICCGVGLAGCLLAGVDRVLVAPCQLAECAELTPPAHVVADGPGAHAEAGGKLSVTGLHVVTDPWTAAAVATFTPGAAARLDRSDPAGKLILDRMDAFTREGSGYLAIQNSRPQTIGYGLADSPLLQLAWIAEKVHEWTDLPVDRD